MKLVVDTNVLLGALIKNSTTRSLLLNPNHSFYVPELAIDEVERHFDIIMSKSGLKKQELKLLFDLVLDNLEVVPIQKIAPNFKEAERVMEIIDEKDAPFLALSLSIDCDGIWSNDDDFKEQKLVKVFTTAELLRRIR